MPRVRASARDLSDAPVADDLRAEGALAGRLRAPRYNNPAAAMPLRTAASSVAGYGPAT